jgi:hypothetical protein
LSAAGAVGFDDRLLTGRRRRHRARVPVRFVRLIPAAFAVFELRYLFASLSHCVAAFGRSTHLLSGSSSLWLVAALTLCALLMLREIARGLNADAVRPDWSRSLLRLWLLCAAAMLAVICCGELAGVCSALGGHGAFGQTVAPQIWSAIPAALCIGLLVAVSLRGARWVLSKAVGLRRALVSARRRQPRQRRPATVLLLLAATPLLAGWSDRGPPTTFAFATA